LKYIHDIFIFQLYSFPPNFQISKRHARIST